ncbi:hypothetical protein VTJ04DRAFT_10333 [Mycothermus thermophilus]|uniref:uncharacterized protein n=1 Tax=Humicola insolens TaxID=85995 RepID=UPI00374327D9
MTTNKASDSNAGVQKVNDKGSTPAQLKYFFLSLPAEVRLKIYDFALDLPMAVVTDQHSVERIGRNAQSLARLGRLPCVEYRMFLTHEDFDAYAMHLVDLRPLVPNLHSLVVLYNPWKTFAGENFDWSCYHPRMRPRITSEQLGQFIRTMRKVLDDRYGNLQEAELEGDDKLETLPLNLILGHTLWRPNMGLFLVNKQVSTESLHRFYSINDIALSSVYHCETPPDRRWADPVAWVASIGQNCLSIRLLFYDLTIPHLPGLGGVISELRRLGGFAPNLRSLQVYCVVTWEAAYLIEEEDRDDFTDYLWGIVEDIFPDVDFNIDGYWLIGMPRLVQSIEVQILSYDLHLSGSAIL